MREACLYNNWSFVPIFLKIYRALMRWTPCSFFWEVAVMSPHDGGTHLEWGVGVEGSLPNSFGWEFILFIKTPFYGGALTLHFMGEHSSPTSIFPVFMMTSSNGNMFRVTGFFVGNSPVTAGNSPVIGEFPSHRPVTRSFDVFFEQTAELKITTPVIWVWHPYYTTFNQVIQITHSYYAISSWWNTVVPHINGFWQKSMYWG